MNVGSRYDVNNSINQSSAYPGIRSSSYAPASANRYRTRTNSAGELGAVNQDAARQMAMAPSPANAYGDRAAMMANGNGGNGFIGQPARWWIGLLIVGALFVWASRRFNGGDKFTNIRMSVYNGIFLTIWIVLILNLLKVMAAKFPIPGLAPLILAA